MRTTVFHPDDLLRIDVQAVQLGDLATGLNGETGNLLAEHFAISGWLGDRCLGAAGIVPIDESRAMAWALIGKNCGRHMLAITRTVREALELHPAPRIETVVFADHQEGRRWAEMLGMICETPNGMRGYSRGRTALLYARVCQWHS